MTNDMTASTTSISTTRRRTKRVIRFATFPRLRGRGGGVPKSLAAPCLDPERARCLVPGRDDALQPFRQDVAVGAEEEGERRQLVGVDRRQLVPRSEERRVGKGWGSRRPLRS